MSRVISRLRACLPGQLPRKVLHDYWRRPWDRGNRPAAYLGPEDRSRFVARVLASEVPKDARVLEIGCNVGRNLHVLHEQGFHDLTGIEISEDAVRLLRGAYPELAGCTIYNAAVEDVIRDLPDGGFEAVFTFAVFEHLHPDSDWVFAEVRRITGDVLLTVEDERSVSPRHFPRDYGEIFEALGMTNVSEVPGELIDGLRDPSFVARVFWA